jgi:hypothetical protein
MPEQVTGEEALEALRERIRATQEAAERLVREATAQAAATGRVPPRGWEAPPGAGAGAGGDGDGAAGGLAAAEVQALVALLESLRSVLPPDLRDQVADLVRQLLLVLRALIDWLVDRMEHAPRGDAPPVEDIPIA